MKYPTANITLKGMEDKGLTVQVIDSNDKKWTVWKSDYNDKSKDSEAYSSLKSYRIGETFGVTYDEKEDSFVNQKGDTVKFTKRTIYNILPQIASPTSSPAETPSYGQNTASQSTSRAQSGASGRNFEQEAYEKCCSIWAAATIQSEGLGQVHADLEMGRFWELFQAIKADGQKRFSPVAQAIQRTNPNFFKDEVPTIQQDEPPIEAYSDDPGADIPF